MLVHEDLTNFLVNNKDKKWDISYLSINKFITNKTLLRSPLELNLQILVFNVNFPVQTLVQLMNIEKIFITSKMIFGICSNINLDFKFVDLNNQLPWDWEVLSQHSKIPLWFMRKYKEKLRLIDT